MAQQPPTIASSQKTVDPSLKDLLDLQAKQIKLDFNCHAIATVQSFDSDNQTVTATINYRKTRFVTNSDETFVPVLKAYPIIIDAPAVVLTGGAFSLKMPITKGDTCIVLFNDRDMDNWFTGAVNAPNASGRLHSFADAMVLVGVRSLANSLSGYEDGKVVLGDGTDDLKLGGGLAGLYHGTTLVELDSKVKIANATRNLNTVLQSLITAIEGLIIDVSSVGPGGGVVSSASQTSLMNIATQLGELLK